MLIGNRHHTIVTLAMCCGFAIAGCEKRLIEKAAGEQMELSEVPAAVKAAIDGQAQGRPAIEIERHMASGATRYVVMLGSGNYRQELILNDRGRIVAMSAGEEDDD
jgi:hypothetical protein